MRERFAARKAAALAQQAALAASKAEVHGTEDCKAAPCRSGESERCCDSVVHSAAAEDRCTESALTEQQSKCAPKMAPPRQRMPASHAAMRVEALREELAAAEAAILELKRYLAEAEQEVEEEQQRW